MSIHCFCTPLIDCSTNCLVSGTHTGGGRLGKGANRLLHPHLGCQTPRSWTTRLHKHAICHVSFALRLPARPYHALILIPTRHHTTPRSLDARQSTRAVVNTPLRQFSNSEATAALSWVPGSPSCLATGTGFKWLRLYDLRGNSEAPLSVVRT